MVQKVRYNGGTQRMYECSDPTDLIVGKEYEVIQKKESDWHTEYILRGVKGEFNSVWFDEVSENIYMAVSRRKPEPGKIYACSKLEFIGGKLKLKCWTTSIVKNVEHLGNDIFKVKTENNIYIIKVVD